MDKYAKIVERVKYLKKKEKEKTNNEKLGESYQNMKKAKQKIFVINLNTLSNERDVNTSSTISPMHSISKIISTPLIQYKRRILANKKKANKIMLSGLRKKNENDCYRYLLKNEGTSMVKLQIDLTEF